MKINEKYKFKNFYTQNIGNNRKIDFLVLHHIEAKNVDEAIKLLKKHEVSSHYIVDEDGQIYSLVDENNIAYHAGKSFWNNVEGLNKNSIGIEFVNSDVNNKKFNKIQLENAKNLILQIIKKYKILSQNIVAHSDIAYFDLNTIFNGNNIAGFLGRKNDPSHQFDWKFLHRNSIGLYASFSQNDEILYEFGDKSEKIGNLKQKLSKFGYKINEINNEFNLEMLFLTQVFNRRFNQKKYEEMPKKWYLSSDFILDELIKNI